jgi:beta-glucosidase
VQPDIEDRFGDYAAVLFRRHDRVPCGTINEPWVIVDGGFQHGAHAPGHRSSFEAPFAAHHLPRTGGGGLCRRRAGGGKIGIVINLEPKDPATDRPEDAAATARADAQMNRHYLDALFLGSYPPELAEIYGEGWPSFPAGDFARIGEPIDFVGVNYYSRGADLRRPEDRDLVAQGDEPGRRAQRPRLGDPSGRPDPRPEVGARSVHFASALRHRERDRAARAIRPVAGLRRFDDPPGRLPALHVSAMRDAMADGGRARLLRVVTDNLEAHGFSKRLACSTSTTQPRCTPKSSASFLRALATSNGAALDDEEAAIHDLPEA